MSEQENLKKYMLLGINNTIMLKECIENEILILLVSLPLIAFNIILKKYLFLIVGLLPAAIHPICAVKLISGKKIDGIRVTLYGGINMCCFSFLFGLGGIEILIYLFEGMGRIIMLSMVGAGYMMMLKLYEHIVRKQIEKTDENSKGSGVWIPFTACGALGMAVARPFAKIADNKTAFIMICICCMILSYMGLSGIVGIFKYRYVMRHKEML